MTQPPQQPARPQPEASGESGRGLASSAPEASGESGRGLASSDPAGAVPAEPSGGVPWPARVSRGVRWRVVGQLRRLAWVYRGVRWRVVGQLRRLLWVYRGVRWRVVGQLRRLLWVYRGVRWRVIGRFRKFQWFLRRRRRQAGVVQRRVWAMSRGLASRGVALAGGAPVLRNLVARGEVPPTWLSRSRRSEILEAIDAEFDALLATAGGEPASHGTLAGWKRSRRSRALFSDIAPVTTAVTQYRRLALPLKWNRELRNQVGTARFVTGIDLSGATPDEALLRSVVPILVSGRPVVPGDDPAEQQIDGDPSLAPRFAAACRMTEDELALTALAQLRALFGFRDDLVTSPERRPRLSVVMATNRPEFVRFAVDQIRAQRHVDVELFVGMHGFGLDAVPGAEFDGGAVSAAVAVQFDHDVVFGDVLAGLSEQVTTDLVVKWDDDDLYGVHHLLDLWIFSVLSRSALVGKAAEFVELRERELLVRRRGGRPYRESRFLAGGALLMSAAALRGIGNWGSLSRGVDQDIIVRFERNRLRTFRLHGYEFVLVRHDRGHTWAADSNYFLGSADTVASSAAIASTGVAPRDTRPATSPDWRPTHPVGDLSVSICVPNKDNPTSVALFEQRCAGLSQPVELVICDDRSDPPLSSTGRHPHTRIVSAPAGTGFGAGRSRHRAFEASGGDVLVFVDADMHVSAAAFDDVVDYFRGGFTGAVHARIEFAAVDSAAAAGFVERGGLRLLDERLDRARVMGQEWRERHWAASGDLTHPRSSSYRAAVGAFVAIDRATYARTGGFRDVIVRGVEDTEFGYRLSNSGCAQIVHRGPGIWHLGERTFSAALAGDEEQARETHLSAYVPIWNRTLAERRDQLTTWPDTIVPFLGMPPGADTDRCEQLVAELGPGSVTAEPPGETMLDVPFAWALTLTSDPVAARAVQLAHQAFRNRTCGEVLVVDGDRTLGRFVATWAVNRALSQLAMPPLADAGDPSALADAMAVVRRDSGLAVVTV